MCIQISIQVLPSIASRVCNPSRSSCRPDIFSSSLFPNISKLRSAYLQENIIQQIIWSVIKGLHEVIKPVVHTKDTGHVSYIYQEVCRKHEVCMVLRLLLKTEDACTSVHTGMYTQVHNRYSLSMRGIV